MKSSCSICHSPCYYSYLTEYHYYRAGRYRRPLYTCSPQCEALLLLQAGADPTITLTLVKRPGKPPSFD